jgi:hypothetical protein
VSVIVGALAIIGVLSLIAWTAFFVWAITTSDSIERDRLERQAAEASWRIHRQATAAFAQMLEAAREEQCPGRSP